MLDLTRHPRLLKLLSYADRLKGFVLRRNGEDEEAGKNLASFYEKIWREAAESAGAEIVTLGQGVLEIRRGDFHTRVQANATAIDDLATHVIVRTKSVMYRLLAEQGLPVPRHFEFTLAELPQAATFFDTLRGPCVVKPACDTGGGLGVTTGITTRWQLARAAQFAAFHSSHVLLEEQIPGDNYRLLYLDGELLDAVVRHPPSVTGDGRSTVAQLLQAENAARLREGAAQAHGLVCIDLDMHRTLEHQGLTLQSVPVQGQQVTLKTATNENSARDNVTVTDQVCDAVVAAGARAVRIAGVRLAGVDVLTTNPKVALEESGGVILEVNNPPGYYWHYHKRDGAFPVAEHVLRALMKSQRDSSLAAAGAPIFS